MENRSRGGNIFVCVLHRDACVRGETGAKMRATGGIGRQSGRRRAEETKPDRYTPQKPGVTGNETPGFVVSEATAGPIHTPLARPEPSARRALRLGAGRTGWCGTASQALAGRVWLKKRLPVASC